MIRRGSRTHNLDFWRGAAITAIVGMAVLVVMALPHMRSFAQNAPAVDPNNYPNPYLSDNGWAKISWDRRFGMVPSVSVDRDGKSIWVFDRCSWRGCQGDQVKVNPVQEFDSTGKLVRSWGAGMTVTPHGLWVDQDDNIWITDFQGANGKGQTVMKFTPDGKLLMTLGTPGVAGTTDTTFNGPSAVATAPDGTIFVGDGHGGNTNARIVKFSKDGKFIKAWGSKGSAPGQISSPHSLAIDSQGRIFEADRDNNRIQIFDQDGNLLAVWKQFGTPSAIYIDPKDTMYVSDSQSPPESGFKWGVRVGSAKDGSVKIFVPWPETNTIEAVGADYDGNIYAGFTNSMDFRRFSIHKPASSSTGSPAPRAGGN